MPRRGLLRLCPRKVHIVFGEPLCPDQLKALSRKGQEDALIDFARNAIVDCQQEAESWRQEALQQSVTGKTQTSE